MIPSAKTNDDLSVNIELDESDLLDIDGSDDQTVAFAAKRALFGRLAAPAKKQRQATMAPPPAPDSEEDVRETIPIAMKLLAPMMAARKVEPTIIVKEEKKVSPTISPAPTFRPRNAEESYPPIAISAAHRERALSFVSEKPSRAGWITAAVIGGLILVGASMKVGSAPKAAPAAAAPVAAAEQSVPPAEDDSAKVVHFGDDQGVSIKSKAEAKNDKSDKSDDKKKAAAPHVAAAPPKAPAAAKPASTVAKLSDGTLALGASKDDSAASSTKKDDANKKDDAAQKAKLSKIEKELADLQLKAASR